MVTNGVPVEVGCRRGLSGEWRPGHHCPGRRPRPETVRCSSSPPRPRPAPAWCASPRRSPTSWRRVPPQHDREASFPHASIDALKRAGYFTAPIPVEYGGLGVTSVHDVIVASSRLARGDASVAIGVNMHLVVLVNIVRRWQAAVAAGDERRAAGFGAWLEGDRPRRRGHGDRDQRARPGPHPAADHGDPHAVGLADRRPQGVLHDVAGRDGAPHRRHVRRRRRRRALRLRAGPARRRGRRDPRRLGRARHARLGQPLRDVRRRRAPALRAARRLPRR